MKEMNELKEMEAAQLHARINGGEPILLLDVRNAEAYRDWKIEGAGLQSVNIAYFDFLEEEKEAIYNQLPKNTEIVVVCAKGISAKMVAELLDTRGFDVSYLRGGMQEWSQFYHPVTIAEEQGMKLVQFNRLAKGCLSYMILSQGEALIVDPGRHVEEYIRFAQTENVTIKHIMDTHLHADHISGGLELAV
ncbi:MAG: rhodanese-like domain-containing protein, partial [Tumebacillaceae bacterium]